MGFIFGMVTIALIVYVLAQSSGGRNLFAKDEAGFVSFLVLFMAAGFLLVSADVWCLKATIEKSTGSLCKCLSGRDEQGKQVPLPDPLFPNQLQRFDCGPQELMPTDRVISSGPMRPAELSY